MEQPIWYLDVDGVLNATSPPSRRWKPQFEHTTLVADDAGQARHLSIWWRPAVVDFVNHVHRSRLAEVRWLTTWGEQARTVLGPALGLDDFVTVGEQPQGDGAYPDAGSWWKVATILEHSPTGSRIVFTDDDLTTRSRAQLAGRFGAEDALLITPMPSPGLTDQHLSKIHSFLAPTSGAVEFVRGGADGH